MTDRELLEAAAKAANIHIVWPSCGPSMACRKLDGLELWNPLEDDGDALRLAAVLQISTMYQVSGIEARGRGAMIVYQDAVYEDDAATQAATRRAIVRAAAAIGATAGRA